MKIRNTLFGVVSADAVSSQPKHSEEAEIDAAATEEDSAEPVAMQAAPDTFHADEVSYSI